MMRVTYLLLHSLPFEPMALTTADTLQARLQALRPCSTAGGTSRVRALLTGATVPPVAAQTASMSTSASATRLMAPPCAPAARKDRATLPTQELHWFDSHTRLPFFISPKHDGIRLISYVDGNNKSTSNSNNTTQKNNHNTTTTSSSSSLSSGTWTCYSRYGRPIEGVFWIESELQLLRALSGDARLVLDGELYLHSSPPPPERSSSLPQKEEGAQRAVASATKGGFLTGFLAVSSLVKRLRGSCSNCATVSDILQYVPTLPRFCVFDIPSYNPPVFGHPMQNVSKTRELSNDVTRRCQKKQKSPTQRRNTTADTTRVRREHRHHSHCHRDAGKECDTSLADEVMGMWDRTMRECHISSVEELRIVPNVTPFSSRLRTMHFLFTLLERGAESARLRDHFQLVPQQPRTQHTHTECDENASRTRAPAKRSRAAKMTKSNNEAGEPHKRYRGAVFTGMVPYTLARSLSEAKEVLLPRFIASGYEGAVVRSPMNAYEMREKAKHTIRGLVQPLLDYPTMADEDAVALSATRAAGKGDDLCNSLVPHSSLASVGSAMTMMTGVRRICGAVAEVLRASPTMVHTHTGSTGASYKILSPSLDLSAASVASASASAVVTNTSARTITLTAACEGLCHDNIDLAQLAMSRTRLLSPRSSSVVKLLPFSDQEYAILRPLFKEPSVNPRTRPLLSMARAQLSPAHSVLRSAASATSVADATPAESDSVMFYGLECLASNGRVFHVTLPKMSVETQQGLLDHLMQESRRGEGRKGQQQRLGSLTGLYATIKFPSLTEHGVPRFGTVKAIRGGKGWFL